MSIFSKVFGKKKTIDTTHQPQANAHQQQAAQNLGPNEQANAFDGFEVVNDIVPDGTPVADVYLNVDTESKSRSHMTLGELIDCNVGHTWLSVKPLNGELPADLNAMVQPATRTLIDAHGETAMGFWPVEVREKRTHGKKLTEKKAEENADENAKNKAEVEIRKAKGLTAGSGTISREEAVNYELHGTAFGRDTDGRVEEPDDAHKPKGRKVFRLTRKQFRDMYRYIDAHRNHKYNLYTYNCTTFAAHALRAGGQTVPMEGMTMPTSLYEAMYKEAKQHEKDARKAKRRNQNIGESSVQLLKLSEGEVHRKKGKAKEGPNGKDVRVKGVEKFDMPMFTDPAEVLLKKALNAEEIDEGDKSLFVQFFFKDSHLRSIDAVKALTEEAVKINLISEGDRKELIEFYEQGYNLIQNPRVITSPPALFYDYMIKILDVMPSAEVAASLFDGKQLSPEHELNKLSQRVLWNAMLSGKSGEEFEHYIEPIRDLTFMEALTTPLVDGFKLALSHYKTHLKRSDLNRVRYLTSTVFQNDPCIHDAVYDYYKNYYNHRIKQHIMTAQDVQDAHEFGDVTQIQRVLDSYPKIERALQKSNP